MLEEINKLSARNFREDDALVRRAKFEYQVYLNIFAHLGLISLWSQVVCVLSHGELGSVFGTDKKEVFLQQLTQPFTSQNAPTLAKKPKMFFIQACQGKEFQYGYFTDSPGPSQHQGFRQGQLEEDAGPVYSEAVASQADFLVGMATVPHCKSFRSSSMGSVYIQELCFQLKESAMRWVRWSLVRLCWALWDDFIGWCSFCVGYILVLKRIWRFPLICHSPLGVIAVLLLSWGEGKIISLSLAPAAMFTMQVAKTWSLHFHLMRWIVAYRYPHKHSKCVLATIATSCSGSCDQLHHMLKLLLPYMIGGIKVFCFFLIICLFSREGEVAEIPLLES